jgi:hypothetical protein
MSKRGPDSALEPYQPVLWYWYIHENHTLSSIHSLFRNEFPNLEIYRHRENFPSSSTLKRAFRLWEFKKYSKCYNSATLDRELWVYFYHWGLTDTEILRFLEQQGYTCSMRRYSSTLAF